MNSVPQLSTRRRAFTKPIAVVIGVVVMLLLAFLWPATNPRDQLRWLTPAEFARVQQVTPFTRLKYQLINWTAPLWKSYWQNRPRVTINARVLKLSAATLWPTDSVPPFVTATNGTRTWILSAAQIKDFQTQVEALPETAVIARPQVITIDGSAARMSVGNSLGTGSSAVFAGLDLYVVPLTANDKISLTIGLNHTELEINLTSGVAGVKTNQVYACRALLPNDGGLLLENPTPEPGSSNRFMLLLTARAVDANGRLLGQ